MLHHSHFELKNQWDGCWKKTSPLFQPGNLMSTPLVVLQSHLRSLMWMIFMVPWPGANTSRVIHVNLSSSSSSWFGRWIPQLEESRDCACGCEFIDHLIMQRIMGFIVPWSTLSLWLFDMSCMRLTSNSPWVFEPTKRESCILHPACYRQQRDLERSADFPSFRGRAARVHFMVIRGVQSTLFHSDAAQQNRWCCTCFTLFHSASRRSPLSRHLVQFLSRVQLVFVVMLFHWEFQNLRFVTI